MYNLLHFTDGSYMDLKDPQLLMSSPRYNKLLVLGQFAIVSNAMIF